VEIDGHPVRRVLRIEREVGILRVANPEEIPGRIDERVHRVGLAPGGTAAHRALDVDEPRDLRQRRIAAAAEGRDLRELDRQLVVGYRYDAVLLAVDDRD